MSVPAAVPATGGIYYGWWAMVPAAFLTLLITNGLTVGGIAAFDPALIAQLGVTRGDIKVGDGVQLGVTALLGLLSGKLVDRYGFRPVMLGGVAALLWGFYSLGLVRTLQDYYLSRAWMGLGLSGAGMAICMVAVSRWFVASRGLALGLVLAGTSFGNGFMPYVFTALIAALGWQTATLATVALLAVVPFLVWGLMREWPGVRGLQPLGAADETIAAEARGEELSYLDIVRRPDFWLLAGAAFCTFYAVLGINNNMILHMMLLGQSQASGAAMAIPLFMAGLSGKILAGWLSDRYGRKAVWLGCLALMLAGSLCIAMMRVPLIAPGSLLLGLGWGANYTLLQAVTGDLFGTRSLGRVMGAVTVFDAGGGALGPVVTASLSDRFGNYQNGFLLIGGLIGLAILCASLLKIRKL